MASINVVIRRDSPPKVRTFGLHNWLAVPSARRNQAVGTRRRGLVPKLHKTEPASMSSEKLAQQLI